MLRRIAKIVSAILGIFIGGICLLLFYHCLTHGTTPLIRDKNGNVVRESIASLERVRIGGIEQSILIRGKNKSNPVLLILHGGPGMPQMYLAHAFQMDLENDFIVVQWDRRGAGKSYGENISPETINVEQLIFDTDELTQNLRKRFQQPKIYLLGHSWGTYLGMLIVKRFPELFYAYVGVGQLAYLGEKNREAQNKFLRQKAKGTSDEKMVEELITKGEGDRESLLFKYGAEIHNAKSWTPLLIAGLQSPEYELKDVLNIPKGVKFIQKNMKYNVIRGDLIDEISRVEIPVYFFTGRYDYTDPFELTVEYYEKIDAPVKKLVWFENSAHFPFYEEPKKFAEEMRKVLEETYQ